MEAPLCPSAAMLEIPEGTCAVQGMVQALQWDFHQLLEINCNEGLQQVDCERDGH